MLPRWVSGLGFTLAFVLAAGLGLVTSALPAILDLRPGILVVGTTALPLLVWTARRAAGRPTRVAAATSTAMAGMTIMAAAWDLGFRYRTEEVAFESSGVTLHGTLYLPRAAGRHPAVVLVHGSGRQPRDEYRMYARRYAASGVAALAYDKRGSGRSGGDVAVAPYELLAADVERAVTLLRGRQDVDPTRVGIWGLSEGEWVGPLAAAMTDPAFLVLVSPSAMTPSEQIAYEAGANVRRAGFGDGQAKQARELYERLARFQRTGAGREALNAALARASSEPWFTAARYLEPSVPEYEKVQGLTWFPAWRARMDFDAIRVLARLTCPVLAQVGGSDPKNDGAAALRRIESALARGGNSRFTGVVYPDAGHSVIEWRLPLGIPPPWFARGYLETQIDWVRQQVSLK